MGDGSQLRGVWASGAGRDEPDVRRGSDLDDETVDHRPDGVPTPATDMADEDLAQVLAVLLPGLQDDVGMDGISLDLVRQADSGSFSDGGFVDCNTPANRCGADLLESRAKLGVGNRLQAINAAR